MCVCVYVIERERVCRVIERERERENKKLRLILNTAVYPDVKRPSVEGEGRTKGT